MWSSLVSVILGVFVVGGAFTYLHIWNETDKCEICGQPIWKKGWQYRDMEICNRCDSELNKRANEIWGSIEKNGYEEHNQERFDWMREQIKTLSGERYRKKMTK